MLPPVLGCHAVISHEGHPLALKWFQGMASQDYFQYLQLLGILTWHRGLCPLPWAILNSEPKSESFVFEILDVWIRNVIVMRSLSLKMPRG